MTRLRRSWLPRALGLPLIALSVEASAQAVGRRLPTPPVPGKSLPTGPIDRTWREPIPGGGVLMTIRRGVVPIERSFAAAGVQTVILRGADAERAEVVAAGAGSPILVAGLPEGNEVGYHPASPDTEVVASPYGRGAAGLGFAAQSFGSTLVISTANETQFIHHDLWLVQLRVSVPPGVTVVRQATPLVNGAKPGIHLEAP